MYTVYVQEQDFGRYLDIYFVDEAGWAGGPRRLLTFDTTGDGAAMFTLIDVDEGVTPPKASLSLSRDMAAALVDALTSYQPSKIDEQILATLAKESERVDKMLDKVLDVFTQPPTIIDGTRRS